MIHLLLVEDQTLVRESLIAQLRYCPQVSQVSATPNMVAAAPIIRQQRPNLLLLDIDMPQMNAAASVAEYRDSVPDGKVLFLSAYQHDAYIEESLAAQVDGYLLKHDGLNKLRRAIEVVCDGGLYFSGDILSRLTAENGTLKIGQPKNAAIASLTPRERELLLLLGRGNCLKEAAAQMGITYKTADNQKASLMRKLGIHDRVALALLAVREGLIPVYNEDLEREPNTSPARETQSMIS
ncbi:MAG: response regulator transcription factor [Phycisphaerales bacterium]|nr:response regulator transcription factor [Phycisphaerales bacterium]